MTAVRPRLVPVFEEQNPSVADDGVELGVVRDLDDATDVATLVMVVIPAYNEERYIGSVVHGVRLAGFQCLVIDDGSSDRTVEIARAAGATVALQHQNQGKAAAVRRAIQVARQRGVDHLVIMDGDWQHNPEEIEYLLEPLRSDRADIVSGSRFMPDSLSRSIVPAVRDFGLRAVTMLSSVASGHRVSDSQTGFRAFSRRAIETMQFRSDGFSVEVEVLFLARVHKLRYVEVPISARYHDRPKRNVFAQGTRVMDGLIRMVAHYRPLLFFGLPSGILLLVGVALGLSVVSIYQSDGELAGGYALLAALMIVVAVVGLFAGLLLHVLRGIVLGLERQLRVVADAIDSGRGPERAPMVSELDDAVRSGRQPG
jgi:glycosyltransferase involved in cell wall biosynthesis